MRANAVRLARTAITAIGTISISIGSNALQSPKIPQHKAPRLVKLSGLFYLYATFLGSVVGGVVNCVINYGWVFHADDCKKTHVALKYLFVWGGSILLNTWGTFALTEWLR